MDIEQIMDMFSSLKEEALDSQIQGFSSIQKNEEIDINKYFEENRIKDRELKSDDMITVSIKEPTGYKAVFVSLGDLVNYLKKNI